MSRLTKTAVLILLLLGMANVGLLVPRTAMGLDEGFDEGFKKVSGNATTNNIKNYTSLSDFILAILAVVATLIAVIALAALIWGAVMYVTSMGNDSRTETAKKIILYALIGLAILGAAGIVVNVVLNIILA